MPEMKKQFTKGKMNKDLDERLVPQGEYRDAMNIQVRTTASSGDGEGDAGVVQNIQGNVQVGTATGNELNEPSAYTPSFVDTNFLRIGFENDTNQKTEKFFRIINEIPTILLLVIVVLVVFQPIL